VSQTYIASAGDTVDFIAWRFYGTQGARVVERVLEANKGLADLGAELPAGTRVTLPDLDIRPERDGVKLWD
jgi:phage tail protein X